MRYDDAAIGTIQITDRLVVVRSVPDNRSAPPPYRRAPYKAPGSERP